MKVYVTSGDTKSQEGKSKLIEAEKIIKSQGHSVLSPRMIDEFLPEGFSEKDRMDSRLNAVSLCEVIFFLKDYQSSNDSMRELIKARDLKKNVQFERVN